MITDMKKTAEKEHSVNKTTCATCFHHCVLAPGQTGICRARWNKDGIITSKSYGQITALALDPIEKKPLRMFYPGSRILSVGTYGCNLSCPFCQNAEISQVGEGALKTDTLTPNMLAAEALGMRQEGNIGVAYTYNEPLVGWEYVRDTAKIVRSFHMKNVVVTNGTVEPSVLKEIVPYIDAMNIDLKGFTAAWYKNLGGNLENVKNTIKFCVDRCHIELTTLIVPDCNDSEEEMRNLASWVASVDKTIPLHITRFFPHFQMSDILPTGVSTIYELAGIAQEYLTNVFTGNC